MVKTMGGKKRKIMYRQALYDNKEQRELDDWVEAKRE